MKHAKSLERREKPEGIDIQTYLEPAVMCFIGNSQADNHLKDKTYIPACLQLVIVMELFKCVLFAMLPRTNV